MSSGVTLEARYRARQSRVFRILIQPETLDLVIGGRRNSNPGLAVNQPISVSGSTRRRNIGLSPRRVVVKFTGTVPAGYSGDPLDVTWLNYVNFDRILVGERGEYLGEEVVLLAKHGESYS